MNAGDGQDAATLIRALDLAPHPEGGWYRETWRAQAAAGQRAAGTAILFLLEQGQRLGLGCLQLRRQLGRGVAGFGLVVRQCSGISLGGSRLGCGHCGLQRGQFGQFRRANPWLIPHLARGNRKPDSDARAGQSAAHCGGKLPGRRSSSSSSRTSASQPSASAKRMRQPSPSRTIVPVAEQDKVVPNAAVTANRH